MQKSIEELLHLSAAVKAILLRDRFRFYVPQSLWYYVVVVLPPSGQENRRFCSLVQT